MSVLVDLQTPVAHGVYESEDLWWATETWRRSERLRVLESAGDAALAADLEMCARDAIYWIENYAWMFDPKQDEPERRKVPVVLFPRQKDLVLFLLSGVREKKPRLVLKGRELGVSWSSVFLLYWLQNYEESFTAKVGSRKEDLVDDGTIDSLFGKLRYCEDNDADHLRSRMRSRTLKLQNAESGAEITGEATNAGFSRGGRRRVILLDEFAHVESPLQSKIWNSTASVAASRWIVSTPAGPGSKFADLVKTLPADCVMTLDWETDVRRPANFKALCLEQGMTDDEFAQEHEAKIVTLRTGRIWNVRLPIVEYDDDHADFVSLVEPRQRFPLTGGWDFGSGASLLCCVFGMVEMGREKPRVWIDAELVWQHTEWRTAATDSRQLMSGYGGRHVHFGDPAGRSPESDQQSWESNLRAGGIPLFCLDNWHNTSDGIEWGIKEVQAMFADGRLRVHRRCVYLWDVIENWRRDVPEGTVLDYLSRKHIPPRHDVFSHGGMALVYLVSGILKSIQSTRAQMTTASSLKRIPKGPEDELEYIESGEDRFGRSGYGNPLAGMPSPGVPFLDGAPMGDIGGMLKRFYGG